MSKPTHQGGYHEIEFKLDAHSDQLLRDIQVWVVANPRLFTPPTHPDLLEHIPEEMRTLFQRPVEVTEPRIRLYWDTEDLDGVANDIEIRQELRSKGGVKQMIKIGGNASMDDPILDRVEHPANLKAFGVDFDAVKEGKARDRLKKIFGKKDLKPVIAMISQRTRIKYHPEGDKKIEIEIGFDYPCWGYSFDGLVWEAPQLELELVKGPSSHRAARALLEREARRFEDKFQLARNVTFKPTPGFEHLGVVLAGDRGRRLFRALRAGRAWWVGARRTFRRNLVAKVALTG